SSAKRLAYPDPPPHGLLETEGRRARIVRVLDRIAHLLDRKDFNVHLAPSLTCATGDRLRDDPVGLGRQMMTMLLRRPQGQDGNLLARRHGNSAVTRLKCRFGIGGKIAGGIKLTFGASG